MRADMVVEPIMPCYLEVKNTGFGISEFVSIAKTDEVFFTIEKCAKFQPKTVPLNTKKLISSNPSFPPSFINNRYTFIYTRKIIEA